MAPALTVMQRIERLEQNNTELNEKLATTFDRTRGQLGYVMEVVEAFTSVVATDPEFATNLESKIEANLLAKREVRKQERRDQENKQLASMVEMGVVKPSETITTNSLIVGRSFDAQGEVQGIGREQFEYGNLHPSAKESFLGKEVGFIYEVNGNKMEVLEIYEITPQNEVKASPVSGATETPLPPATPEATVVTTSRELATVPAGE